MVDRYEQKVIAGYLWNLLQVGKLPFAVMDGLCGSIPSILTYLGISDEDGKLRELLKLCCEGGGQAEGSRRAFHVMRQATQALLAKRVDSLQNAEPGILERNIRELVSQIQLDRDETAFLGMLLRYRIHEPLYELFNALTQAGFGTMPLCASCLGLGTRRLHILLTRGGRLFRSGVIVPGLGIGKDIDDSFDLSKKILHAFEKSLADCEDILSCLLGHVEQASLEWSDYDHIALERDRLARFLKQAVARRLKGINVLLYGPVGTGKTEFSKTLAAQLGFSLYALGEQDEQGEEPTRHERISSLQVMQNLLRFQQKSLLLFDEMDDLLENAGAATFIPGEKNSGSKVFIHRLLEDNPVPVIWTINRVSNLTPSIIRRMSFAIEMKNPPLALRQRVWQRHLAKEGLELSTGDLKQLTRLDLPPAVVSNAVRFARFTGGAVEDFKCAADSIVKAMKGGGPARPERVEESFAPRLSVADCNLMELADLVAERGKRNVSFCLYGPSGTGKTAYVRYLADRMQMPVLVKHASDLLSMWVGETERNIANAFAEARENESFLVFDEVDSLLGDRRMANASWEISQVNEMLTWMEQHPLPFACTTNLKAHLDPAAMRRFTFKCRFDYLGPEQVVHAFRHFFGLVLAPEKARELTCLTPGDFVVVRKKADFYGGCDIEQYVEWLRWEVQNKNEAIGSRIGFTRMT
ncbi:SpoVK/Ycf46/Vps4 family AAA+-type ATPase [Geothermobacter ehrlichii]|uniref:SpoVK/Ycf46/Vps4 family AAA+-type ATPase n=1 Tax=Geothermobacter ehrlichii TaxID=213224 RepID=A0A5D3WML4_9BACT|nr:ATP-binding protein [Geothermobacter ehrlichii]TYO99673.1 SpoVK/Ycf46/Vps4 family AAA+-type ATPase [Geothermobacter ehrlichii]